MVAAVAVMTTNKPTISLGFENKFAVLFTEVTLGVAAVTHVMRVAISIQVHPEPVLAI